VFISHWIFTWYK